MKREKGEKKEKSRASMIIDGEIEPEPHERGLLNLRKRVPFNEMSPEKRLEICQKGQKALMELHGEQKTAREALKSVLTLKITDDIVDIADIDPSIAQRLRRNNPNATLYDLIQAVAVGRALDGNVKAMEYVRDTHGDKPIDRVEVTENITTNEDREMMRKLTERLEHAEVVEIVKDITPDNVETGIGAGEITIEDVKDRG